MKILLATDGSDFSMVAARECGKTINIKEDTTIRIVCVADQVIPPIQHGISDEYLVLAKKAARGVAEDAAEDTRRVMRASLEQADIDIETKTVVGSAKEEIVREAESWGADLIVVGSQGRGFWGRMLLGSVSNAVVKYAPCSVLVVRKSESKNDI